MSNSIISYSVDVYRKDNGSNITQVSLDLSENLKKIDVGMFLIELEKVKNELLLAVDPDIETSNDYTNLYD